MGLSWPLWNCTCMKIRIKLAIFLWSWLSLISPDPPKVHPHILLYGYLSHLTFNHHFGYLSLHTSASRGKSVHWKYHSPQYTWLLGILFWLFFGSVEKGKTFRACPACWRPKTPVASPSWWTMVAGNRSQGCHLQVGTPSVNVGDQNREPWGLAAPRYIRAAVTKQGK